MLIFDGSFMLHRSILAYDGPQIKTPVESKLPEYKSALSYNNQNTSGIFGLLEALHNTLIMIPTHITQKILCVWDGKKSVRRMTIYPDYKGNRVPKTDTEKQVKDQYMKNFNEQQTILKDEVLPSIGISSILHYQKEGDDMIYKICELYHDRTDIVIVSEDRDMLQLIQKFPTIRIYRPIAKELIYKDNFTAMVGIPLELFMINKALLGDKTDNIKNVPSVGDKSVAKIVSQLDINDPIKSLFNLTQKACNEDEAKPSFITTGKYSKEAKIYKNWGTISKNLELLDLSREVFDSQDVINLKEYIDSYRKVINPEKFAEYCLRFGFKSILKDVNIWLLPFKN